MRQRRDKLQGTLDLFVLRPLPAPGRCTAPTFRIGLPSRLATFCVEEGSLYPALHRMEEAGWIKSQWKASDNNRRARYYQITASGRRRLSEVEQRWTKHVNAVIRRASLEREFDDEIRFHLEERTRRNAGAGMSPEDAAAAAVDRFGSITRAKAGMRLARLTSSPMAAVSLLTILVVLAFGTVVYRSSSGQRAYDVGAGMTAPVPVVMPHPGYTAAAKRAKIQGTVRMRCIVRPEGVCEDVTVIRSLDRTFGLDDEAVRALRGWRFRPALRKGAPVPTRIDLEMRFALR